MDEWGVLGNAKFIEDNILALCDLRKIEILSIFDRGVIQTFRSYYIK